MLIPNDQQHELQELDLEAEMVEELEPDSGAAERVRGGAMQPYLTNIEGQKQGSLTGGCPPPKR